MTEPESVVAIKQEDGMVTRSMEMAMISRADWDHLARASLILDALKRLQIIDDGDIAVALEEMANGQE